jgi:hypothetical protein
MPVIAIVLLQVMEFSGTSMGTLDKCKQAYTKENGHTSWVSLKLRFWQMFVTITVIIIITISIPNSNDSC